MPQFDFAHVFWPQLAWLAVCFMLLYAVVSIALPRLARVLDAREHRINDDLANARAAKAEAEASAARHAAALAAAREAARDHIGKAKRHAVHDSESRLAVAHEASEGLIHAAERRIAKALAIAETALDAAIAENAAAIVARVTSPAGKPQ